MEDYILPNNQPLSFLDCDAAFNALTEKEKLYAHHLSRASWYGSLIVLVQTSSESPLIYTLLHKIFYAESVSELKKKALSVCDFTEDDFTAFLIYTCGILDNLGNYKGCGDTKFVPNLSKEKFLKLVSESKAAVLQTKEIQSLLANCIDKIYLIEDGFKQLGFPDIGVTTYSSKNVTKEDREIVKHFMKNQNFEPWNSRLFKTQDETGTVCFEIRLASILPTDDSEDNKLITTHTANGHKFIFTRGDYSKLLKRVNENLLKAKEYAANETEACMIEKFIESFRTGSVDAHKDGSRFWIRDKSPIIESYIGFIETYRDPDGIRAEFEGFVAIVNKSKSKKFELLVDKADEFLPLLPWPRSYENTVMIKPDFTSLDVLTFCGSMIPSGICIPNYNEIRGTEGFKNVNLGNVIICNNKSKTFYHLNKEDAELMDKHVVEAFEVNVGIHELLGHGSGKLFNKGKDGPNFDENVFDFETNSKITSWYEDGETYISVFSTISSSYEECRAEAVALYLSTYPEVLRVFGYEDPKLAEDILYVLWLNLMYSGIKGFYAYEPKTNSWLQAHIQARFVLLQVLIEAGEDFIQIKEITGDDGKPDILYTIDRAKILSVGKPAIGAFLAKLQLYKSTANITKAREMYDKYSTVTNEGKHPFLKYRDIIVARKQPRMMIVQSNTFVEDGKVTLKTYEANTEGFIKSSLERFDENEFNGVLEEIWEKDRIYFA